MTVKELMVKLLEYSGDYDVIIEYPNKESEVDGNYCRYSQTKNISVAPYAYESAIILEILDEH